MICEDYVIVRLDYRCIPESVEYVAHGEAPHDLTLRFAHFRESATRYSNRREAIREARRLGQTFTACRFKVSGARSFRVYWESRS